MSETADILQHRKTPALCIKFANTELALDDQIAGNIFVWRLNKEE